jgi:hypothetical protein
MAFKKYMKAEKVESADSATKEVLRKEGAKRVKDLSKAGHSRLRDALKR